MVDYKARIEAEYEAIEKIIDLYPERIQPLASEIPGVYELFKTEIEKNS